MAIFERERSRNAHWGEREGAKSERGKQRQEDKARRVASSRETRSYSSPFHLAQIGLLSRLLSLRRSSPEDRRRPFQLS